MKTARNHSWQHEADGPTAAARTPGADAQERNKRSDTAAEAENRVPLHPGLTLSEIFKRQPSVR